MVQGAGVDTLRCGACGKIGGMLLLLVVPHRSDAVDDELITHTV